MRDRRNALLGALVWWFARRWLRKRAATAVGHLPGVTAARPGRLKGVLGAFALVGALAGAFVLWRKLGGAPEPDLAAAPEAQPEPPASPATE